MLKNADVILTARIDGLLVSVSRPIKTASCPTTSKPVLVAANPLRKFQALPMATSLKSTREVCFLGCTPCGKKTETSTKTGRERGFHWSDGKNLSRMASFREETRRGVPQLANAVATCANVGHLLAKHRWGFATVRPRRQANASGAVAFANPKSPRSVAIAADESGRVLAASAAARESPLGCLAPNFGDS